MTAGDDPRLADTNGWLEKANLDLRAGTPDLTATPPLLEDALFHAQLAAEKSMKAFLTWYDLPFGKTHDLRVLGQDCVRLDSSLQPLMRKAVRLSQYAWKYRYPGDVEPPSTAEVHQALELATEINSAIGSRVSGDAIF